MGHIKRVLAKTTLDHMPLFFRMVRMEAAEEHLLHLHWRDMRILLWPIEQFKALYDVVQQGYEQWNGKFTPKRDIYLPGSPQNIPDEIVLGDIMSLEEQTNGVIHFHYRDLRFELAPVDFIRMGKLFREAMFSYASNWDTLIPLEDINPYDKRHWPTKTKWIEKRGEKRGTREVKEHKDGIQVVADGIEHGGKIFPILVEKINHPDYKYQRLDGFKRYMAYNYLGFSEIPCYVVKRKHLDKYRQHAWPFWIIPPEYDHPEESK